jgi:transposase
MSTTHATILDTTTKKLEHLPVIASALKRLKVAKLIDEVVPPDPRNVVTTGQCIEALVVAILTGTHTLYLVDQLLRGYDLELGLGWSTPAGHFHDQRLARSLDAILRAGLNRVVPPIVLNALKEYKLDVSITRVDTTSSSVHGEYADSEPPDAPGDPDAIPHVTKGRSKDHPGLKQIVFGVAATNEGVPLYGRAASGNRADPLELRYLMRRVAELLPKASATTVIGDSKLFSGETILLAAALGVGYVTLVPKTTTARDDAIRGFLEADRKGAVEVLLEKKSRSGELETWRGCSVPVTHDHKDEETKVVTRMLIRTVVVESSGLARQKKVTLEKERARERRALDKWLAPEIAKAYHCEADAEEARKRIAERTARFHKLTTHVSREARPVARPRGRPKKRETRATESVWVVSVELREDERLFANELTDASCFVLATSHLANGRDAWSDLMVFESYHDQYVVEDVMHHFKGDLRFAPVHLKDRGRLAALAQVYVIALMVYALIQREARGKLAARSSRIAGNLRLTATPTTEVIFRLFENVNTMRVPNTPGVTIQNLTTAQVHGYEVLGLNVLKRAGVQLATPRAPGPADRGYYRPRPKRGKNRPTRRSDP